MRHTSCTSRSYHLTQLFCLFSNCFGKITCLRILIILIPRWWEEWTFYVHTQLLVSMITSCVEVDHLCSTFIMDTSVGEIVLLDRVCHSCELENADRNIVDDSYYHYYIWYIIYVYGMSCTFDAFDVWFGRRLSSFTIWGIVIVLWESIWSFRLHRAQCVWKKS